mgnify:CR=1 FL=1
MDGIPIHVTEINVVIRQICAIAAVVRVPPLIGIARIHGIFLVRPQEFA